MQMTDTGELLKRCMRNDASAQRALYDAYAPKMLGICYRYTKSMEDAEDVMQMGFIKAFQSLQQYRHEGDFGAWLRRIMVNTALNFLKKNSRYAADMYFSSDEEQLHPVIYDDSVSRLSAKELAACIRQLPAGYQAIFNLFAVDGYSHAEIAGILGIKEATSRSQFFKARSLLIKWLGKEAANRPKNERHA